MKVFKKNINGIDVIRPFNKIVLIKDGMQILSPTEAMVLEDGWVECIMGEKTEVQNTDSLSDYRNGKIKQIMDYDASDEVNIFFLNDMPMWLDKATRVGLILRFQAEKSAGKTDTTLWYNGLQFTIAIEKAMSMLYAVELYASACFDNTQRHIASVSELNDFNEIEDYDYTIGYPDKLRFHE